ncbi:MAG: putative bifunctional diguanylate cyclase/phosphodiesterase [Rhodoferax sp.]
MIDPSAAPVSSIWRTWRWRLVLPMLVAAGLFALLLIGLAYAAREQLSDAWAAGASGLLFAALLQLVLLGMIGRAAVMRRKNQQLQHTMERALLADKVILNSCEGIVVMDVQGRISTVNPAFTAITGYGSDEMQGANIRQLMPDHQHAESFERVWQEITTHRQWRGEIRIRRKGGEVFAAWMSLSAVLDETGAVSDHVGALTDMTEHMNALQQIDFLAFQDALTGLPNRILGQERLQQALAVALRHQSGLAVLCLDLDGFKHVNDTQGHATGDALLRIVAQRLTACLRKHDMVCRLSADEFMVVLQDVREQHHVASICEKILHHLAQRFDLEGVQLNISFSIGVAIAPQDGSDHETLMRHADTALFEAKEDGRNTYRFFDAQMNTNMTHYVQTRDGLRLALERKEFELYYQPQIDLASERLVGVEALIRWNRPGHGLVMPGAFIPAAEESGLIVPIGNWVLREACRQAALWNQSGWSYLVVAVNLSAVQFRRGELADDVAAALRDSGLDPAHLELELTESVLLRKIDPVLATIGRLKALGIRLSIDDFGTGYSSLSYLQRFDVDSLKIDRSFVTDLLSNKANQAIVQAVIQIARNLNLKTIAEGVKDTGLAARLKAMGCDQAQGYLYARPLPVAQLQVWMSARALQCAA